MKKILYITVDNFSEGNSGIVKKIKFQQRAFLKLGFQCDLLYSQNNKIYVNSSFIKNIYNRFYRRLLFFYNLSKYIELSSYDSLYIRYPGSNIFFIKFLKKVKERNTKIVIEIPTYPYDNETKGFFMRIFNVIDKIYRKQLYTHVDKIVTFSNDDEIYGIKTIKINNGIDIEKISLINKEEKNNNEVNFIGVARLALWHGYDRFILSMAKYYKNNPKEIVKFHIVGDGDKKLVNELKKLVVNNNLEKYVTFYGYKSGKELDEVYEYADIGVGSLGIHRNNHLISNPLKLREYLAKGLPVIIGYIETEKIEKSGFCYKLPHDESLFDIEKIVNWYKKLNITPQIIRKFAEDNLTWDKQMKKIVDYILETEEKERC